MFNLSVAVLFIFPFPVRNMADIRFFFFCFGSPVVTALLLFVQVALRSRSKSVSRAQTRWGTSENSR